MQLYAWNDNKQLVHARQALKHTDYFCLECDQIVRSRGGPHRQRHFYHLEPTPYCRQHQKGPIHLELQSYFVRHLPEGDCHLEYRFPSINRIADVVWLSQKIVFEIQYSPISAREVLERNRDYQKEGWTVVWILHEHRYNHVRLSAAEMALRSAPHFFSNMNSLGVGIIYDQFDVHDSGLRKERLSPLPVNINRMRRTIEQEEVGRLSLLNQRVKDWGLSFEGDLLDLSLTTPMSNYLKNAVEREKNYYPSSSSSWRHFFGNLWFVGIIVPYQTVFRFFLERSCR